MHNPTDPAAPLVTGAPDDELIEELASNIPPRRKVPAGFSRAREVRMVRRHNCYRTHRTFEHFANCAFRRAIWVSGDGEWGTVSYCKAMTKVMLHKTEARAREKLSLIDNSACGGLCTNRHEIVRLVLG